MPVGEPVQTTAPVLAVALIVRTPCLQARYMPVRFTRTISSQTDWSRVSILPSRSAEKTAALETRMSSRPKLSTTLRKAASTEASSPTSQVIAIAVAPVSAMDLATAAAPSLFRSRMATLQPSSARRRAAASPIPEAAPVTAAIFPFNPRIFCLL